MAKNIIKRNRAYRDTFFKKNKGFFGIYMCYVCNKLMTKRSTQVDHVMPISKLGGTNLSYNLMPICSRCNQKKSNKINHLVLKGYSRKFFGTLLSIPFIVLSDIWQAFKASHRKLQWILLGVILYGLYRYFK